MRYYWRSTGEEEGVRILWSDDDTTEMESFASFASHIHSVDLFTTLFPLSTDLSHTTENTKRLIFTFKQISPFPSMTKYKL